MRVGMGDERATAIGKTTLELFRRNGIAAERVPVVYRAPKIDELGNAVRLGSIDATIVWDAVAWGYQAHAEIMKIPEKKNVTVPVAVAIVSASRRKALAQRFIAFMGSGKGRAILRKHHYSLPVVREKTDHAKR
jgi:molybdate transport system substrate-binding protein